MFSFIYVVNDEMNIKNFQYAGAAFAFFVQLLTEDNATEIMIRDNKGEMIYKWKASV